MGGIWGYPPISKGFKYGFWPKTSVFEVYPRELGGYRNPDSGAPGGPPLPGPRDPRGALGSSGGPSKSTSLGYTQGPANRSISSVLGPPVPPQNTLIVARLRGGVKPTPSPLCLCNMRLLPVSKLTFSSQATGVVHATYVVVFANAHCLIANAHHLGVACIHIASRLRHATCMTTLALRRYRVSSRLRQLEKSFVAATCSSVA